MGQGGRLLTTGASGPNAELRFVLFWVLGVCCSFSANGAGFAEPRGAALGSVCLWENSFSLHFAQCSPSAAARVGIGDAELGAPELSPSPRLLPGHCPFPPSHSSGPGCERPGAKVASPPFLRSTQCARSGAGRCRVLARKGACPPWFYHSRAGEQRSTQSRGGHPCPWGQGSVPLAGGSGKGITFKCAASAAPPPGWWPAAGAVGAGEVAFPYTVTGEPLAVLPGEFLLPGISEKS